jgi:hypothetical protein
MADSSASTPHIKLVPGDVKRFMQVLERLNRSFTTAEFAGYFYLTTPGAREILNEYAVDGLITFLSANGEAETWAASRDGRDVFAYASPKFLKRDIEKLKAALTDCADLHDVLELSVGGRPALGKRNGKVLIGVRFGHEPYTRPEHELVVSMLAECTFGALASHRFAVLPFHEKIPGRLNRRLVLKGPQAGKVVQALKKDLDAEEELQLRYRNRLLTPQNVEKLRTSKSYGMPSWESRWISRDILNSTADDLENSDARIQCARSMYCPDSSIETILNAASESLEFRYARKEQLDYREVSDYRRRIFLAEIEYRALGATLKNWSPSEEDRRYWYRVARSEKEKVPALLGSLQGYLDLMQTWQTATPQNVEKPPPAEIEYFAYFDCLNFPAPRLVGFVRQPASNRGAIRHLEDFWYLKHHYENEDAQNLPVLTLDTNHLDGTRLSLFRRPATVAEIEAFKDISNKAEGVLRCILIEDGRYEMVRPRGMRWPFDRPEAPAVLNLARLGPPVIPKLLVLREYERRGLRKARQQTTPSLRHSVDALLIDTAEVPMQEFASLATNNNDNPMVQAARLQEWQFTANADAWAARLSAEGWSVSLENGQTLHIELTLGALTHEQQLHPWKNAPEDTYMERYSGQLHSLLEFMQMLVKVKHDGLENALKDYVKPVFASCTTRGKLAILTDAVSGLLSGFNYSLDGKYRLESHTAWPSLCFPGDAESDKVISH